MTKLRCARFECKYNGKNNVCKAKTVSLSSWYGNTTNEGYQEFLICKCFEESEESKNMAKALADFMAKGEKNE